MEEEALRRWDGDLDEAQLLLPSALEAPVQLAEHFKLCQLSTQEAEKADDNSTVSGCSSSTADADSSAGSDTSSSVSSSPKDGPQAAAFLRFIEACPVRPLALPLVLCRLPDWGSNDADSEDGWGNWGDGASFEETPAPSMPCGIQLHGMSVPPAQGYGPPPSAAAPPPPPSAPPPPPPPPSSMQQESAFVHEEDTFLPSMWSPVSWSPEQPRTGLRVDDLWQARHAKWEEAADPFHMEDCAGTNPGSDDSDSEVDEYDC